MTSKLSFSTRNQAFAGARVLTAAMLDRLPHQAQVVRIQGDGYRLTNKRRAGVIGPVQTQKKAARLNRRRPGPA